MPDKSWKAFERYCAKLLGTMRTPLSGGMSGHGTRSDTLHSQVFLECKHTKGKSAQFTLWEDTKKKAKREGKVPALAQRKKGTRVSTLTLPLELGMEALRLYLAYKQEQIERQWCHVCCPLPPFRCECGELCDCDKCGQKDTQRALVLQAEREGT